MSAAEAAGSPPISPSHNSDVERIKHIVEKAVRRTLDGMLKWEKEQIDTSLCRATMQYLKFAQRYLERRKRAGEMLTRRLAMCSSRYDTLLMVSNKTQGIDPGTPINHDLEIAPPTPSKTGASPDPFRRDSDPTGQSQLYGLPTGGPAALREAKKQKRLVSETSRQLKKILAEWDDIFIALSDFCKDLEFTDLPADNGDRAGIEGFHRQLTAGVLDLISVIRKSLAEHGSDCRERPKMMSPSPSHPPLRFNASASSFVPGGGNSNSHRGSNGNASHGRGRGRARGGRGGTGRGHRRANGAMHANGAPMAPQDGMGYGPMMAAHPGMHPGMAMPAMMQGLPGYFPGMANMVMVPAPSGYGDTPYVNSFGDSDSVTSEGSSDWSAEVSGRAPALWFREMPAG